MKVTLEKLRRESDSTVPEGAKFKGELITSPEVSAPLRLEGGWHSSDIRKVEKLLEPNVLIVYTQTSVYKLTIEKDPLEDFDVDSICNNPDTPLDTRKALNIEGLRPNNLVKIGEHDFFLSKRIVGSDRQVAIAYVPIDGLVYTRCFYRSKSDGNWRLNGPNSDDGAQEYCKTLKNVQTGEYRHYTREAKLDETLVAALEDLESNNSSKIIEAAGAVQRSNKNGLNHQMYEQETQYFGPIKGLECLYDIPDLEVSIRGGIISGKYEINPEYMEQIVLPNGFVPDFKNSQNLTRTYQTSHSFFSKPLPGEKFEADVSVEVYQSVFEGYSIYWHMCTASNGQVWIDRIDIQGNETNSFGVRRVIYDLGILDLKPVEYASQSLNIPDEHKICEAPLKSFDPYFDITPFLSLLPPIRLYKESKKH